MNANKNLVIDFMINKEHDHFIGEIKHTQPHQKRKYATKPKKITHNHKEQMEKRVETNV